MNIREMWDLASAEIEFAKPRLMFSAEAFLIVCKAFDISPESIKMRDFIMELRSACTSGKHNLFADDLYSACYAWNHFCGLTNQSGRTIRSD